MERHIVNNLYSQLEQLIRRSRQSIVQAVNLTMVSTYFKIGGMIVEYEQEGKERAEYGSSLLKKLSEKLSKDFGKGFSVQNLENRRKFYLVYSKSQTVSRKTNPPSFALSFSHYLKLIRIKNVEERSFYEIEAIQNNWSLRELQRQFDSALYQRLLLSTEKSKVKELAEQGQIISKPSDALKDPYILEFVGLEERRSYSESDLENELINKLEAFLLELGKGFTFVARQKRISFDEKHFKIDLVFYNRLLKSFVLIDLKIGELKHQDLGQMQMYVNYYDRFVKLEEENKTVGIILCQDKSDTLVEITLPKDNEQIFASKYLTVLPSKEELIRLIEEQ
ncbi:MAG: PDDEXK nuclease domain-containing protein [Aureispira sp.]